MSKINKILCLISLLSCANIIVAQTLQGECIKAGFGIDAYIYANGTEYVNGNQVVNNADDWFYDPSIFDGTGRNVIDTLNASYYKSMLQSDANIFFSQEMSVSNNAVVAGRRWQDATYVRDYYGGSGATDSTSYVSASKNGQPLNEWATGLHNVVPKNDLIDCYAHLRRDGIAAENPLWLFVGFSRISSTGDSYFDVELFANGVEYDQTTGFNQVGNEEGHSAWQFDENGNITKYGDMIVTVNMSTNGVPEFEVRIWVRRFDFNNVNPVTFDFGNDIDGASNGAAYGYADIVPPMGNEFGCGVTNQETWVAPPWGTLNNLGDYANFYEPGQFVEIGLNLYDFGIDPQLVVGLDACDIPFNNLLFKSRASSSFTAQLKDFSGPFTFVRLDKLESTAVADTITCENPIASLEVEAPYPFAYYEWTTLDGNILSNMGSINDTIIFVDEPGTYILASAYMNGCEMSYDTLIVEAFTESPPASIGSDPVLDCQNINAHFYALDDGFAYNWIDPNGNIFSGQSINVTEPGIYYLEVTNEYGCVGVDSIFLLEYPCQDVGNLNISTTTIIDDLPPYFTQPPDITIECIDDYLNLGITGDVTDEQDNCDPNILDAIFFDNLITDGFCAGTGQINRTWSLTDICGNTYSAIQKIILIDNSSPTFVPPVDVTISCAEDYTNLDLTGVAPIAYDECDSTTIMMSYSDVIYNDFDCVGQVQIERIWTATDDCGNVAVDTQLITMIDDIAPEIIGFDFEPFVACDSIPEPPTLMVLDNCDPNPIVDFSEVITSADCPNSYILVRTWTVTDACGNESMLTQEMNVEDNANPTILAFPPDITISCDSIPYPFDPEVADNCDEEIDIDFNEVIVSGNCEGSYTIVRSWTWVDDCGNETSELREISVIDNIPPSFTVPQDVTISCSEDYLNVSLVGEVTDENDNCTSVLAEAIFSDEMIMDCVSSGTIFRTWSLTDDCGNTTEHIQTITIVDSLPPIFNIPSDITLQCDIDIMNLTLTGNVINEIDNCDTNLTQPSFEDFIEINPNCSSEQIITRVWTLEDGCGNLTVDTQSIFIIDTIPPIIEVPDDITIDCYLDSENFSIVGEAINAMDNCDENLDSLTYTDIFIADENCIGTGVIRRNWSIMDECGNSFSEIQLIQLIDTIPPTFTVPSDISLSCDQNPNDLGLTGDVVDEADDCFDAIGEASYLDSLVIGFPCEGSSLIYRTWTLEDGCGNSFSEIQLIVVEDIIPPNIGAPNDIVLDCFSQLGDTSLTGVASIISDDCSSSFGDVFSIDSVLVNDSCNFIIQRIWLGTDACGNIGVDTQFISIIDTIAPVFNESFDFISVSCDSVPLPMMLTASDNCDTSVIVLFEEIMTPGNCADNYTLSRTWTATDQCGNSSSFTQNIEIQDFTQPVILTFPPDMTVSCDSIPAVGMPTAADNCDEDISMNFFEEITAGNCSNNYTINRTWSWIDNCGNTISYSQLITVVDEVAPSFILPDDITISCIVDVDDLNFTGNISQESDNCNNLSGNAIYTDSIITQGMCNGSLLIQRTWMLTDSCGNNFSDIQMIMVNDTLAPIFTVPADVTLSCGENLNDLSITGNVTDESDDCDATIGEAIYVDSMVTNVPCEGASSIYRNWVLTDDCGNEFSEVQIITIEDNQAPVFSNIPIDMTVSCDSIPTLIYPEVVDSCGSYTVDFQEKKIALNCGNDYTLKRVWVAIDACGNQDSVIQMITIKDTLAPILNNAPSDITLSCENLPPIQNLDFFDNCSNTLSIDFTETMTSSVCVDVQIIERNWTATDECGNLTTFTQQITLNNCGADVEISLPPDTILCVNENIVFETSLTEEYDTPNFQWQFTSDTLLGWTNIVGATGSIFSINGVAPDDEGYYQVVVANDVNALNDTLCSVVSDQVHLQVLPPAPPIDFIVEICEGDSIFFTNQYLTATGQYVDTLVSSLGCDSIVTMDLIVYPVYEVTNIIQLCEGDSIVFGNNTYTVAGSYDYIFQTVHGCDSLVHLELEVAQEIYATLSESICEGDSIMFQGAYYNDSGIYIDTLNSVNGCDSIVTMELSVAPIFEIFYSDTICFGEDYVFGNDIYSTSTSQTVVFQTIEGCDSIVHLDLLVNELIEVTLTESICEGDSVFFANQYLTATGQYVDTLVSSLGCDSIVTMDLIVYPVYEVTNIIQLCEGDSIVFGNNTYTATGSYDYIFQTVHGCDSLVHLELEVTQEIYANLTESICEGDSIMFQGVYYNDSGIYIDTLNSVNGCDSIVTMELLVAPIFEIFYSDTICFGENYVFGSDIYSTSTSQTVVFQTIEGCDSIVHLDLLVNELVEVTLTESICEGDSVFFANQYLTATGQYVDTLVSSLGCDSIVTMDLIVYPVYEAINIIQLCEGIDYQGVTYLTDTVIVDSLQNNYGCDSILISEIFVQKEIVDSIEINICEGDLFQGIPYYQDSTLIYNGTSINGCDSISYTDIRVYQPTDTLIYLEFCEGESVQIGNSTYSEYGSFTQVLTNVNGCDSILNIEITVYESYEEITIDNICVGDSIDGNIYYSNSTIIDSLQSVYGCDSILIHQINIHQATLETQSILLCEGSEFQGVYYNNDTTLVDSLQNMFGCDSIIIYEISFVESLNSMISQTLCYGANWNGINYYSDTTFSNVYLSVNGCDSTVTTSIAILPILQDTFYFEICEGESIQIGGSTQNSSGVYTDIFPSSYGCDSLVISILEVHPEEEIEITQIVCEGESFFVGGGNQTVPGIYFDTYQNINGCDSIIATNLIVQPKYNVTQTITICENDSIFLAGVYQYAAGTFIDSLNSINGCDSIIITNLNISSDQVESFFEVTICEGDSIFLAGEWQYNAGTFIENFNTMNGCDSIVTTELNLVFENFIFGENAEICLGDEVQLYLEGVENIEHLTWYPDLSLTCNDCPNPIAYPDETTTYTVTYPSMCGNDMLEAYVTVTVNQPLDVDFAEAEIQILQGDTVILMIQNVDTNLVYTWMDGNGNIVCNDCHYIDVHPNTSMNYTVTASSSDYPCEGVENVIVSVEEMTCAHGNLEVANVIFPQSGSYGDHLEIEYDRVEISVLRIYNRWGELVFETYDMNQKWDGTYNGVLLNPGVYVYYILGNCIGEKRTKFMYSGNVTLIH